MANARELPQFLLDRFIKEIEYNPRLKNYIMQKQLARKGEMVKPGESFVAPVNFAPNKNYEAYKRRVDKYNREARAANDSAANVYLQRAAQREAYDNWDKLHEAERNAGLRKFNRDRAFLREKMALLKEEMLRRTNEKRSKVGAEPLENNVMGLSVASRDPQNRELSNEFWEINENPVYNNRIDGYLELNPNKAVTDWELNSVTPRKPKDPGSMVPSSQEYIYRYHTTPAKNLPYIFNSGLDPMQGGKGFGKSLVNGFRRFDPSELQEVYTAVRSPDNNNSWGYTPGAHQATIRLKIPKKDYLKMDRNDTNPELDDDFRNERHSSDDGDYRDVLESSDKELTTVQHGGRTDIFQEKIPPKYIDEVYTENGEWKDPWSFLEEYECEPSADCDEWYDAISQYLDENGEWDWNKLRKMNKRMGR